jgi:hypothetical protein
MHLDPRLEIDLLLTVRGQFALQGPFPRRDALVIGLGLALPPLMLIGTWLLWSAGRPCLFAGFSAVLLTPLCLSLSWRFFCQKDVVYEFDGNAVSIRSGGKLRRRMLLSEVQQIRPLRGSSGLVWLQLMGAKDRFSLPLTPSLEAELQRLNRELA